MTEEVQTIIQMVSQCLLNGFKLDSGSSVNEVPEGLLVELFREASVSEEDESDQLQWNSENNTRIVLSFLKFLETGSYNLTFILPANCSNNMSLKYSNMFSCLLNPVENSCQSARSGLEYVFGLAGSSKEGAKDIPNLFLDWNAGLVSGIN